MKTLISIGLVLLVSLFGLYAALAFTGQPMLMAGLQTAAPPPSSLVQNSTDCTGPAGSTAVISWNTICQKIDGYGGYSAGDLSTNANLLFGTLGFSLLRVGVPTTPPSCTTINANCANGATDPIFGWKVADVQACVSNGCRVWATSWDPTAAYSTNGSVNCVDNGGGGTLATAHYQDFANYLSNFIASLQQFDGVTIYAISPQNEPDGCQTYVSSVWPASTFDTFVKTNLGPTLAANGQSSTLIFIPETADVADITVYAGTCMADASCLQYVKGTTYHGYGCNAGAAPYYPAVTHYWETEAQPFPTFGTCLIAPGCPSDASFCNSAADAMLWAGVFDNSAAVLNQNAYSFWVLSYLWSGSTIATRAYVMGQYAKYIRPDMSHIGATHAPQSNVTVSAYRGVSGAFSVVATNQDTSDHSQTFTFSGITPTSVTPTITSGSGAQLLQDLSPVSISAGSFTYTLPAQSVITFHGTAVGGGSGIACAIGPNYQGNVPAGAAAAGFNTCAANWDFTQFTSLSQWLDCAGASNPILYNIPGASGNGSDCTAYSMVVDGGANAVQMRIPSGTAAVKAVGMNPIDATNTHGQLFPSTKYIEIRARLGTNEISNCVSPNSCDMQGIFYYIPNIGSSSSNPWGEWDDFECFFNSTNLNCKTSLHLMNFVAGFSSGLVRWDTVGAGETGYVGVQADPTTWHTISIRVVSDGAASLDGTVDGHVSWCYYLDGVQKACRFGNYANNAGSAQDTFQRRQFPTMQNVMDQTETLPGNQDFIIQRVSLFECSGWQAATPLTLNGNNCLNSTAAVTGPLTGTP